MIVAIKNNKIIGVEKELLNQLNATFENLSEKINTINLIISSIKNTPITIENKEFEVREIDFLTLEDIKLYDLSLVKTSEFIESLKPEESKKENIKPLEMEIKPLEETVQPEIKTLEESSAFEPTEMEIKPLEITSMETKEAEELNLESLNLESPQTNLEIKPQILEQPTEKPQPQEGVIVLTFEDEFKEIDELLNLKPNEIQTLLQEELKKASQELGVDNQTINELFETLLEQIKENKDEFYNAIKEKDYEKLHKIAHSLKGASLNLRLSNLALILKYIDEKSKEKIPIEKLELLINKFYSFVQKITQKPQQSQPHLNIDKATKNLILMTIENYLKTQNEKQFKKDLKYIQKILGVNVSNLDELQEIMKGIK